MILKEYWKDKRMKNIPLCIPTIGEEEKEAVMECLSSNFVSSAGPSIALFEEAFAKYVGSKYAVACSSGTAALHLAVETANRITDNNYFKYFVPTFSFAASVNPCVYSRGATNLYFVDACPETWSLDLQHLFNNVNFENGVRSSYDHCIVIPHLYGYPAKDMQKFVNKYKKNIFIIEDATESLGSFVDGKHVGTFGHFGCFSFNGNKMITTGSGGMLVTDNIEYAEIARSLSQQAKIPNIKNEYYHNDIGYNYRMTNIQAALGLAQFRKLPQFLQRKKEISKRYDDSLLKGGSWVRQQAPENSDVTMWLYSLCHTTFKMDIDALRDRLAFKGIETRKLWYPLHKQKYNNGRNLYYPFLFNRDILSRKDKSTAQLLWERGISLPSSVSMTDEEQDYVIEFFLNEQNQL